MYKLDKIFHNDANSLISNSGIFSESFPIQRGFIHGYPLSPYLFIICIELLSYQVTNNKNIKAIYLAGPELKDLLFADDACFILDRRNTSFEILMDIMDTFRNISGLKLKTKNVKYFKLVR